MRGSVYFKDDDERLSFLHGSYITLTNLKNADIARIIKMRISPVNISVHTMNKELRCFMTGNVRAGEALRYLTELSEHGIALSAQLVLCPGINDGGELQSSMEKLYELKSLQSVSIVPVGLTAHREGLYPLSPYTKEGAAEVIECVETFGKKCYKSRGLRLFYPSDEFYLKACLPIPEEERYDGYPQLENGVGMIRSHTEEFLWELKKRREERGERRERKDRVTLITGQAAYEHICKLTNAMTECLPYISCDVRCVENRFFGETVTVSGLITGGDIIKTLQGTKYSKRILIPCNMLRHEGDLFLDGVSVAELEEALDINVTVVGKDGGELVRAILIND